MQNNYLQILEPAEDVPIGYYFIGLGYFKGLFGLADTSKPATLAHLADSHSFWKPYENNCFLIFNELTVSLYLYLLILLTDFNNTVDSFDTLSMILFGVVIFSLIVNIFMVALNFLAFLAKRVKILNLKLRICLASTTKNQKN